VLFFDNPAFLVIWITTHIIVMIIVAKIIKAPFFYVAVGSQILVVRFFCPLLQQQHLAHFTGCRSARYWLFC
jgi:hypothetical protein